MRINKHVMAMLVSCLFTAVYAQKKPTSYIQFVATFDQRPISLDTKYIASNNGDSISIETLKFYISDITFLNNHKSVYKEKVQFHLVNALDTVQSFIKLSKPLAAQHTKIQFLMGIDSSTNASGALGGALDPTNGMYWTWQSGYIHFKLEGKRKHGTDKAQSFQYHIGGYQFPNNSVREISLETHNNDTLTIYVDVEKQLNSHEGVLAQNIMSPGLAAMLLANRFQNILSIRKNDP